MQSYAPHLRRLGKWLLITAPFFGGGFVVLHKGHEAGHMVAGFGFGLLGVALLLTGAVLLALPLARVFAEPFGAIFWQSERFDRPQPMYSIPEARRQEGRFEEALEGFQAIADEHPDEVRPWSAMLEIAVVQLDDKDRATAIFQRGMEALAKETAKEHLAREYHRTIHRKPAPGRSRKTV